MGGGGRVWRWGKSESIHLSLHCHHHNDSCIKKGSGESHFNVSLIGQSHKTLSTDHTTFEEKGEPKWNQTDVLLLTSLTAYKMAACIRRLGCYYGEDEN